MKWEQLNVYKDIDICRLVQYLQKYWPGQRVGRTDRLFGRTKCELSFLRSGELYVCVVNVNATEVQLIDEGKKARCLVKGGRKDKKNR